MRIDENGVKAVDHSPVAIKKLRVAPLLSITVAVAVAVALDQLLHLAAHQSAAKFVCVRSSWISRRT